MVAVAFGTITQLPSGRYRARYPHDGQRHNAPGTFDTKGDAAAWLAEMRTELAKLAHRPASVIKAEKLAKIAAGRLFGPFARDRIAARNLKPIGRQGYEYFYDKYLAPTFDAVALVDIDRAMVSEWFDTVLGDRTGKTSGHTARARAYSLLKSIMADAVAVGYIPANPCTLRGGSQAKIGHQPEILTIEALAELTAAMPERYRALVQLTTWCALRTGEVVALTRADVVVAANGAVDVRIKRGAARIKGQGMVTGTPKSRAGVRTVSMPDHVGAMLLAHMERFTGAEPDALLFTTEAGAMTGTNGLRKPFMKARAAAGRPDLHFHDLRHTGATWAAESGATLAQLMARIGHTSPTIAMHYQHASRAGDRAIADRMAARFSA